ncbi:F510_1955 family glycosylhydrolase [Indiicoccus explosivorum]|uniref:F510_1955 family glycosylhydrolase n=1 Tax=Indiicoccus explosivorum TaxID=1917864 RepID=UPI000B42E69C|nr:glycosyl hydrolase [Indiicoccus explosivorum]
MKKIMIPAILISAAALAACSAEEEPAMEVEEAVEETDAEAVPAEEDGAEEETAETEEAAEAVPTESEIELTHVHGLGITGDGAALYVPAHDGLKVFEDSVWRAAEVAPHDFMGFSMVDDGFYTSGHPAPGSDLKNPFGVSRSTDMGETLENLSLYGEIDFHAMDVGYNSHAIYVINPQPNSVMDEAGLYYSTDDAATWTHSAAEGISGQLMAIAVHPTEEGTVAAAGEQGVFVSEDFGETFTEVTDIPSTAVEFAPDGTLLAGGVADPFTLTVFSDDFSEGTALPIPELSGQNAISYIAVNPENEEQIFFSTFERDIYLSEDGGESWEQIADNGTGIDLVQP